MRFTFHSGITDSNLITGFVILSLLVIYSTFRRWDTSQYERNRAYLSTSIKTNALPTFNESTAKSSTLKKSPTGIKKRLPQVIIIGAKKCGTSTVLDFMGHHPNIVVYPHEAQFFTYNYAAGLDEYLKLMPNSSSHQLTVEKTPTYFVNQKVPRRIHAMNESIRLILIVRDPATRVISDYTHYLSKVEKEAATPFENEILENDGNINESSQIIQVSRYAEHLKRWLEFFTLEQFLFLDGDQLTRNPLSIMKKVENFLKLPPYFSQRNFYFSKTKRFYCFQNKEIKRCMARNKGRKHPDVNPKIISKLRQYYVPFNNQFYLIVGQNFSWPTK